MSKQVFIDKANNIKLIATDIDGDDLTYYAQAENILFTPNGKIHKFLTRLATENLFYPFREQQFQVDIDFPFQLYSQPVKFCYMYRN